MVHGHATENPTARDEALNQSWDINIKNLILRVWERGCKKEKKCAIAHPAWKNSKN